MHFSAQNKQVTDPSICLKIPIMATLTMNIMGISIIYVMGKQIATSVLKL